MDKFFCAGRRLGKGRETVDMAEILRGLRCEWLSVGLGGSDHLSIILPVRAVLRSDRISRSLS